ncbi:MAG: hypothetical protein WCB31_00605 [Nitrososphaeraceae archaeon]
MLLSQTEREWLIGNTKISKGYERKIKSAIRKKVENFKKFELPVLIESGMITYSDVTDYSNAVTEFSNIANKVEYSHSNEVDHFLPNNIDISKNCLQYYKNYMGRVV